MAVQVGFSPSPPLPRDNLLPLSPEKKEELTAAMQEGVKTFLVPRLNQYLQMVIENNRLEAEVDRNIAEANRNIAVADRNIAVADRNIAVADRNIAEADRNIAEAEGGLELAQKLRNQAQALDSQVSEERRSILAERGQAIKELDALNKEIEVGKERLKQIDNENRDTLTKMFYAIFSRQPLRIEEINSLFQTYLGDDSLIVEETGEGKTFAKIKSMKAVTRYLDDHPTVKTCNFRPFKAEVHDVATLADYLKKSKITAIGINSAIPESAKASLSEAVAARNGGLKVQYFA